MKDKRGSKVNKNIIPDNLIFHKQINTHPDFFIPPKALGFKPWAFGTFNQLITPDT